MAAGNLNDDLIEKINNCTICIADISGNNPNVMWELGYVMALRKPTIVISQDINRVPFDIKNIRIIKYYRDNLSKTLNDKLCIAIEETIDRESKQNEKYVSDVIINKGNTISVTGSLKGDTLKCKDRVEKILGKYISNSTTWFVGSWGIVDEIVLKYLVESKQTVYVVGYNPLDFSSEILSTIEKFNLKIIDSSKEQIPKGLSQISARNAFFLLKSDLTVLFWNGKSQGTNEMRSIYENQRVDHIVSYF